MGIIKIKKDTQGNVPQRLMVADTKYVDVQPEGFGEFLFACLCAPCYACARTRYACAAYCAWSAVNVVLIIIGIVKMKSAANTAMGDYNNSMDEYNAAMAQYNTTLSQEDMGDAQILMGDVAVSQPSVAQNAFEIAKVSVPLTVMAMGMILFKIN